MGAALPTPIAVLLSIVILAAIGYACWWLYKASKDPVFALKSVGTGVLNVNDSLRGGFKSFTKGILGDKVGGAVGNVISYVPDKASRVLHGDIGGAVTSIPGDILSIG